MERLVRLEYRRWYRPGGSAENWRMVGVGVYNLLAPFADVVRNMTAKAREGRSGQIPEEKGK